MDSLLPIAPPLPTVIPPSPIQSGPHAHHDHAETPIPVATAGEEGPNAHQVRDPERAAYWRDRIHEEVRFRFPDVAALDAAGYAPTHPNANPVHYTLGGYADPQPGSTDGGVSDLSKPFSLVVQDGRIIGVMLRAPDGPVELGAGEWHEHEPGGAPLMHVFFDRPLDQAFGGHLPDMPIRPDIEGPVGPLLTSQPAESADTLSPSELALLPWPLGLAGAPAPGMPGASAEPTQIVERDPSGEIGSR